MRGKLAGFIENTIFTLLTICVGIIPLFFTNLTTDFFEIPKIVLLITVTLVCFVLWSIGWIIKGKITFTHTPLDIPILAILFITVVSALLSPSYYGAVFGNFPNVYSSATSWVFYTILYFIATSHIKTKTHIKILSFVLLFSVSIIALVSLLSYFHLYLFEKFMPFTKIANFNPAGSSFAASSFMVLLLPIPLFSLFSAKKIINYSLAWILSILLGLGIALTGPLSMQVAGLVCLVLVLAINRHQITKKSNFLSFVPILIVLSITALSLFPLLSQTKLDFLPKFNSAFPKEIQLSLTNSWQIAASSFRDFPILGSGPSTFLFDFTAYKPIEHNNSKYWNARFENGFNEYLQSLATLGGLGLLSMLFFSAVIFKTVLKAVSDPQNPYLTVFSISSILILVILLLHTLSLVTIVVSLIILALFMVNKPSNSNVEEISLGIKVSTVTHTKLVTGDLFPLILLLPITIFTILSFSLLGRMTLADIYHRKALASANVNTVDTYNHLVSAEKLSPYIDLYRIDLAQMNLLVANSIAAQKGPSESSPSGSLTEDDKKSIQRLLTQAIDEGKMATLLSPKSVRNWETLGGIYRQISGVTQNALTFSLDAYGHAIQNDLRNPLLRLNVGGIYYSIKNYDMAIRFFTDAVSLKPDLASAYYNLAIVLKEKGDSKGAVIAAEKAASLIDKNSDDYKTVSSLISELKGLASQTQKQPENDTPPAAVENSPLQKKNLPKVIDLPKNQKIATPEAVKK